MSGKEHLCAYSCAPLPVRKAVQKAVRPQKT